MVFFVILRSKSNKGGVVAMTIQAIQVQVTGRVQGVGFRYFVKLEAKRLGLVGSATNQADGSVLALAQGEETVLADFIDFLTHRQPAPYGRVDAVQQKIVAVNPQLTRFETH